MNFWKSLNTCEKGNRYLKINPKLDLRLRLIKIIFPERFPHPCKYSYQIPHEYWLEPTEKKLLGYVCVIYLQKFLKMYVSQTKKMSQFQE